MHILFSMDLVDLHVDISRRWETSLFLDRLRFFFCLDTPFSWVWWSQELVTAVEVLMTPVRVRCFGSLPPRVLVART